MLWIFGLVVGGCFITVIAKPTQDFPPMKTNNEVTYNPFSSGFKWTKNSIAAVTTSELYLTKYTKKTKCIFLAVVILTVGLALLSMMFFPLTVYKMCYALGGCQNTMDFYLDRLLGVEGNIRKRRDVASQSDLDYLVSFIKMAVDKYGPSTVNNEIQDNVSFFLENVQI